MKESSKILIGVYVPRYAGTCQRWCAAIQLYMRLLLRQLMQSTGSEYDIWRGITCKGCAIICHQRFCYREEKKNTCIDINASQTSQSQPMTEVCDIDHALPSVWVHSVFDAAVSVPL